MNIANAYSPRLRPLFQQGDPDFVTDWSNYLQLGITKRDIGTLGQLAIDREVLTAEEEAGWAPIHAWRTLAMLQDPAAIDQLIAVLEQWGREQDISIPQDDWDDEELEFDWFTEELPIVLGRSGPMAIAALRRCLFNQQAPTPVREVAILGIAEIAQTDPSQRENCLEILTQLLMQFDSTPRSLNGFLVNVLVGKLQAIEAATLMEDAFLADRVQSKILPNWEKAHRLLGLTAPIRELKIGPDFQDTDSLHHQPLNADINHSDLRSKERSNSQSKSKSSRANPAGLSPFILSKLSKPKRKGKSKPKKR